MYDDRSGADAGSIANGDATDNSCIDTNPYFIANGRNTFVLSSIRLTYNDSFMVLQLQPKRAFGLIVIL